MQEYIGNSTIIELKNVIDNNVLLFTQNGNYNRFKDILLKEFQDKNIELYTEITPNPKLTEIQRAQNVLKNVEYDCIVAFGGGSVIDFAKAFRFYEKCNKKLIAIPTTAGTGSEATQFAVVYVNSKKTSLDDVSLLPNVAIIDSQFIEKAPQYLKACCAMDAYCQAIESFWAVRATDESRKYALDAIKICRDWLVKAVLTDDKEANEQMALAAHTAGKAINISRTTAAHALSYKITSEYGIPHGHAVAMCLNDIMQFNLNINENNCNDSRGVDFVKSSLNIILKTINCKSGKDFRNYWYNLMDTLKLEWRWQNLGIRNKGAIVSAVNMQRLVNNPKNIINDLRNFWRE